MAAPEQIPGMKQAYIGQYVVPMSGVAQQAGVCFFSN